VIFFVRRTLSANVQQKPQVLRTWIGKISILTLVISAVFLAASPVSSAAKKKVKGRATKLAIAVGGSTATGTRAKPYDANRGIIAGAAVVRLDTGSSASDGVSNSGDACYGPAVPRYVKHTPVWTTKTETVRDSTGVPVKDKAGNVVTKVVNDKLIMRVEIWCNGSLLRVFDRCIGGNCPPREPETADLRWLILSKLRTELITFPAPDPFLWPHPSTEAPLPGVPFFFGVQPSQFSSLVERHLTACSALDCVSVSMTADPKAVFFDPGDGRPRLEDCEAQGPAITSKVLAAKRKDDYPECQVTYRRAGDFDVELSLLYLITTRVTGSSFDIFVPLAPPPFFATTALPFTMTVHERQPVVIG
jgi:hypothetical protein